MKTYRQLMTVLALSSSLVLSSCIYALNGANTRFTSANVMALKAGMTQQEVQQIFGTPTRVKVSTCGGSTKSGEWQCVIWEYDVERDDNASLTRTNTLYFSASVEPPRLNNWNIEKMW